ncbi:cytochrome P450 [Zopfia rhizophila CBS 207.26]|uniref:Cytochrome P450 n=1 Tax=Zopfia rhizophila CBS 207.26 TaxID=1314779 RepID=A0A6A6EQ95_9PEZI|nr:cytochrome P450 [Zopfia rhizophila CBS 207.26]
MFSPGPLLTCAFAAPLILILAKLWQNYQFNRKYKLPPGPPGVPYFGNLFQMPPFHQGPWAKKLADQYGEMFTVKIADNTWVFLNSSRTVNDLLEKRSAIYSSRPRFPFASSLMSGDCRMVIQPYGAQWRSIRKIMHAILNIKNAPTFAPFQDLESKHLIHDYLTRPTEWYKANQRFANSVIMSVTFGKRMHADDKNVDLLFETSREFIAAIQPAAHLVDTFYVLDYLPGPFKWWKNEGKKAFQKVRGVYTTEGDDLKRRIKEGRCPPCFATKFLEAPDTPKLGETQTLFALGSLMEAGSDTSRMTISHFIAAAAHDHRWVKTAQAELDAVCGDFRKGEELRLPGFEDRPNLKYMSAAVKEAFRWRPFAEIGVPHMLTQDDTYEGYRFPAGTIFTWNNWTIALSEKEYKDPLRFWPERWLNPEIQGFSATEEEGEEWQRKMVEDPLSGHWSFGAGRRVCAGYHVGDTNVWIAAVRMLYCFDFEENPEEKIDTMNIPAGEFRWAPFDVKIRIRSEKHRELVERVGGAAVNAEY